jgi:hypothetical protein
MDCHVTLDQENYLTEDQKTRRTIGVALGIMAYGS